MSPAAPRPRLWPLVLRGLWWRRGLTAAVLAVATLTTAVAALGPLYARAASELILHDHLVAAGTGAGLRMHRNVITTDGSGVDRLAHQLPRERSLRGFERVIPTLYTTSRFGAALDDVGTGSVHTALLWKQGICRHLVILRGHCPTAPNQALASQRVVSASVFDWHVGRTLYIGAIHQEDVGDYTAPIPTPKPVRIVGTYRPRNTSDPFWFGQPYFVIGESPDGQPIADSLIVARSEFTDQPPNTSAEADFDYPLRADAIRLTDVPAERAAVQRLIRSFSGTRTEVDTRLLKVFDAVAHERTLVAVDTALVTVQLAVLAWLVLFQIVSEAIESRGTEVALAKLRGHRPRTTLLFASGEAVVLTTAAVPLGLLLAFLTTHLLTDKVLGSHVPVAVTAAPVLAAGAAFLAALVAVVLGGYRTLSRSVLDEWRRTTRRPRRSRAVLIIDVLIAAGALTGLVLLAHRQQARSEGDSAGLLVPGLLVLAVALLGVRLLPAACRALARWTRSGPRLGLFLATRQVARRPVGLRLAALLAVAVGLATFAVAGESIAETNRQARARADVGAPRVVSVQVDPRTDPLAAVRKADPSGRWAMAAATWLPDGGQGVLGTVLGVDSTRLRTVASSVSGGMTPAETGSILGAAPMPTIRLTADLMRVHLTARSLTGDVRPQVQINLRTSTDPYLNAEGGPIVPGSKTYVVPVPCRRACILRGLTWDRPISATRPLSGRLELTGLDVRRGDRWQPLDLGLGTVGAWRPATPAGKAGDRVSVAAGAVVDRFWNALGGYGGMTYADVPVPAPAIATAKAVPAGHGAGKALRMVDEDSRTLTFTVARIVPVLPIVLDDGVVLDVNSLDSELPGFVYEASWQVWLGTAAPADALARLGAVGLHPGDVRSETARMQQLSRQAPALALLLLVGCAVAGAVLAAGATAISISAAGRRRSYELAALRAIGVGHRELLRAGVLEQLLLLGSAVVLGVPTGLVAARVAMPVIPEFADRTPIELHYAPQWLPTAVFVAGFVVILVITALLAGRALLRIALPARLREAEG